MTRFQLLDELHIQIWITRDLAPKNLFTLRRLLRSNSFRRDAIKAIRSLFAGGNALTSVRVRLAR
jgi:hypothetical protein